MLRARHTDDEKKEAGIDEAGRGCLWGPLMAAAVIWPSEADWTDEIRAISTQIKDSKKVSSKKRKGLEAAIRTHAIAWGLGRVEAEEIDRVGMSKANRLAFQRALGGLAVKPDRVIIDGILGLRRGELEEGVEQVVEPQADGLYIAVAAASILAKEGRDAWVAAECEADPVLVSRYGILNSKGYGTAAHRAAIKQHGMLAGHRRLFLRKLLGLDHTIYESGGEDGGEARGRDGGGYGFIEE